MAIECKMPHEVWFSTSVDYFGLRIFCCLAYAHVNEDKLGPRAKKCIFLCYAFDVNRYRLRYTNPKSPKFIVRRDVIFYESFMLNQKNEVVDAQIDQGIKKQVELEFDVFGKV